MFPTVCNTRHCDPVLHLPGHPRLLLLRQERALRYQGNVDVFLYNVRLLMVHPVYTEYMSHTPLPPLPFAFYSKFSLGTLT